MDRLRAMEYFVRVVEAGSFAAAARELDVSPPAITQLIGALERELGAPLLRRDSRHLSLTPDGEQFLPACANALAELRAAEARLSVNRTRASGKLIVGIPLIVGQHCVAPFLPEFLSRHPGLALDLRLVSHPQDPLTALVDVLISIGWPEEIDMVAKCIAQMRLVTCASPAYWEATGCREIRTSCAGTLASRFACRSNRSCSTYGNTGGAKRCGASRSSRAS